MLGLEGGWIRIPSDSREDGIYIDMLVMIPSTLLILMDTASTLLQTIAVLIL